MDTYYVEVEMIEPGGWDGVNVPGVCVNRNLVVYEDVDPLTEVPEPGVEHPVVLLRLQMVVLGRNHLKMEFKMCDAKRSRD